MRLISPLGLLLGLGIMLLSFQTSIAQDSREALTREQINAVVNKHFKETAKVYKWEAADDHMVWSALVHSNGMASIGYQPAGFQNFDANIPKIDVHSPEWTDARNLILNKIVEILRSKGLESSLATLMPSEEVYSLPFIFIKIQDADIVNEIRNMEEVRYLEPMDYKLVDPDENVSRTLLCGSGCSTPATTPYTINPADYIATAPAAIQSWHQLEHNIDVAWNNCDGGSGIGIAVIDTGLSPTQEKMNAEFAEGLSLGRTVTKYGFYDPNGGTAYDGVDDLCGHGTSMTSLATAPRGFDNTPAGVAYKANLHSYRATSDVIIGDSEEQTGVCLSLMDIAANPNIQIVSMSIGDIFYGSAVATCIKNAKAAGKLLFAAAGTSTTITSGVGVIFPASMPETTACTGIKDGTGPRTRCNTCHEGFEVDFVVCMQRNNDDARTGVCLDRPSRFSVAPPTVFPDYVSGSSNSTATMAGIAALVWGNHPTWTRGQVLNRLMKSADNYPNHDNDFGWGKVDVNAAVTVTPPSTCNFNVTNNIDIEITNIQFPAYGEGTDGTNEWVLTIGPREYYFEADDAGECGHPGAFFRDVCDNPGTDPFRFNLGTTTTCGQTTLPLFMASHEDDSVNANCDFDSGIFVINNDDAEDTGTTITVNMNASTFSYNSPAGIFVFDFVLHCTPTMTLAATPATNPTTVCAGDPPITLFTGSGGTAPYTYTYIVNTSTNQTISDPATFNPTTAGTYLFNLVDITDANGCSQAVTGTTTIIVLPLSDPACAACPPDYQFVANGGTNGGLTGVEPGISDYETDGIIESVQTITATAKVDYDSKICISMDPTFEVVLGAEFHAFIDGCNGGAGGINLQGDTDSAKNKNAKNAEEEETKEEKEKDAKTIKTEQPD